MKSIIERATNDILVDMEHKVVLEQRDKYVICDDCNTIIKKESANNEVDGRTLCAECRRNYNKCEICGKFHHYTECETYVDGVNRSSLSLVCDSCLEEGIKNRKIFYCNHHGVHEYTISPKNIIEVVGFGEICINAYYSEDYIVCAECDKTYCCSSTIWDEEDREYYCRDCYEEIKNERVVRHYHYHKKNEEVKFLKTEKDNALSNLYFGFELEVENDTYSRHKVARRVKEVMNDEVYFEDDNSLSSDGGFEIISRPTTLNYFKENIETYKRMFNTLNNEESYVEENCGLHIHFSKDVLSTDDINNIGIIFEYYRDEIIEFSRRNEDEIDDWADFYTYANKSRLDKNFIVRRILGNLEDRYRVLNYNNDYTIECRIFASTLYFEEFMSCIELLYNIIQFSIDNEIDNNLNILRETSFYEIATYSESNYIKDYLTERNIFMDFAI